MSYDMGWNKCSSGHIYNLLLGHRFIIGALTRGIIACVVFSKKCDTCTQRLTKENTKKVEEKDKAILDLSICFEDDNKESSDDEQKTHP